MISPKIKAIAAAKALVARLEGEIAADLARELASLPARYGFAEIDVFVTAVKRAADGKQGKRRGRKAKPSSAKKEVRTRTRITPAIRAKVKKLLKAGKTGSQIGKAVGVSLASVQNIKKALGLVKSR